MRRLQSIVLAIVLLLSLSACARSAESWQAQYDLGVRYLSEGNYQEAIIAFTAAIEIDPKQAEAYVGLADVYIAQGDIDKAREVLQEAREALGNDPDVADKLEELEREREDEEKKNLEEAETLEQTRLAAIEILDYALLQMFAWNADDSSAEVYRCDFTGDGYPDWIVNINGKAKGLWLLYSGNTLDTRLHVLFDASAAGGIDFLYSESSGQLYIYMFYGSTGYQCSYYCLYDGNVHDYMATYDKSWEDDLPRCSVNGVPCTEESFNDCVQGLEAQPLSEPVVHEVMAPVSLSQSGVNLSEVMELLGALPCYEDCEAMDLDGDGTDDYILSFKLEDEDPCGMGTAYYEAGNSLSSRESCRMSWSTPYVLVQSNGGAPTVTSATEWDVEALKRQAALLCYQGEAALADGSYLTSLYRDGFMETDQGLAAYVEIRKYVEFSDELISSLQVGDYLPLSDFPCFDYDMLIESIERYDGDEYKEISLNEYSERLYYSSSTNTWTLVSPSDVPYSYVSEGIVLLIADDALIVDNYSAMMRGEDGVTQGRQLEDVREFFVPEYLDSYESIYIDVINGVIQSIDILYTP